MKTYFLFFPQEDRHDTRPVLRGSHIYWDRFVFDSRGGIFSIPCRHPSPPAWAHENIVVMKFWIYSSICFDTPRMPASCVEDENASHLVAHTYILASCSK